MVFRLQEYLAAKHLTWDESPAQPNQWEAWAGQSTWWETLRLWSGITWDTRRQLLSSHFPRFSPHLQGCVLADGAGDDSMLREWAVTYAAGLAQQLTNDWQECAAAWKRSRQIERKMAIEAAFSEVLGRVNWLAWQRGGLWAEEAGLAPPRQSELAALVLGTMDSLPTSEVSVLVGRIWCSGAPYGPTIQY
ncbi:MAG: hypothetical protein FJW40_13655 [Acidobacteria bacterium]|nr:hypothetical protein [Acidobacteriota bacterium]